mgnify:CR=1 FL=1
MADLIGQTLAHYHVTAALGAGGMGTVYRARVEEPAPELAAGSEVALKVLHGPLLGQPAFLAETDLHAGERVVELGELTSGRRPGRTDDGQITFCDLAGTGLQDTAIALVTAGILSLTFFAFKGMV